MIVYGIYNIDYVFSIMDTGIITIDEHQVKTSSQRYTLFKEKGTKCVDCGCTGTHFKLEKSSIKDNKPHFNLYTDDNILMTKDHILPKSLGGTNTLDNYQVMCTICNTKKGNTYNKSLH